MTDSYRIKMEQFEGPLDLLLDLIEKRKLFINDISLAKITDEYIEHISSLPTYSIPNRANFILIASTLLLIKSKSLLPTLSLNQEETENIEDLQNRLKMLQRMRELSLHIKDAFGRNVIFPKSQSRIILPIFSPQEGLSVATISAALRDVLKSLPKKEILPKVVVEKIISLEDMISNLTERITSSIKMGFKEFSGHKRSQAVDRTVKVNVIVSFLAMLELVKQGIIDVTQDKLFEEIHMETQRVGVPRYN